MQDSQKMVFEQFKKILLYHTDATGLVTISALCRFAQESAGSHAALLGFGMERLAEQNIAWVLREQAIRVLRYPRLGEAVRIVTWPTRTERILCHRDYAIHDQSGEVVALGTSAWLGLDLATRRPRKADSFFHLDEPMPGPVFEQPLPPLSPPEGECVVAVRTARASDMDGLGHMNNLRYLDWITDHLAVSGLGGTCRGIAVRYVREVVAGDEVEVRHAVANQGEAFLQMAHRDHGKEVCLARIELGPGSQARC